MFARPAFCTGLPLMAALAALGVVSVSGAATAEDTITATWFSDWGDVKYDQPFDHLDYVNPDAPKGGDITIGTLEHSTV